MNDATRLERFEDAIVRAREAARGAAVLVEGPRDRAALDALGVGGTHITVNQGRTLAMLIDRLVVDAQAAGWPRIVVIMDWDRTGATLQRRLEDGLAGRVAVDVDVRRRLRRISHATSLEEVPADLAALRRRVG